MSATAILIAASVTLIASLVVGIAARLWARRLRVAIGGAVTVALVVIAVFFWLVTLPPPNVDVLILVPLDGASVQLQTIVQGEVTPSTSGVYILIHPLNTDRLWVQNLPVIQGNGRWQAQTFIGTESSGIGESYEVIALATNENVLMRTLRGAYLTPGQQLEAVPPYFAKSNLILVTRKP